MFELLACLLLLFPAPRDLPPFEVEVGERFEYYEIPYYVAVVSKDTKGRWMVTLRSPCGSLCDECPAIILIGPDSIWKRIGHYSP